jgi:hypothetical protein
VYGTKVHTAFEAEVKGLNNPSLSTEVSYLDGRPVSRGTPGSIRLDVVEGDVEAPSGVYDLKTGGAKLTDARIQEIRSHLPAGSQDVPIQEVKPDVPPPADPE